MSELRKTNEILKLAGAYFAQAVFDCHEVNASIDEHRAPPGVAPQARRVYEADLWVYGADKCGNNSCAKA